MVELALLLAITIIMGTTPLGTIRTPFLSISLVTIPVAIGANGMMSTLIAVNPFLAVVTILDFGSEIFRGIMHSISF